MFLYFCVASCWPQGRRLFWTVFLLTFWFSNGREPAGNRKLAPRLEENVFSIKNEHRAQARARGTNGELAGNRKLAPREGENIKNEHRARARARGTNGEPAGNRKLAPRLEESVFSIKNEHRAQATARGTNGEPAARRCA